MRLIDNLEELEVGDYISYSKHHGEIFICKVDLSTKLIIQIKPIRYHNDRWDDPSRWITCIEDKYITINKNIRKSKKRKLKHKIVTYNDERTIFKLTEKEKGKIIKEMILEKLE